MSSCSITISVQFPPQNLSVLRTVKKPKEMNLSSSSLLRTCERMRDTPFTLNPVSDDCASAAPRPLSSHRAGAARRASGFAIK
ncbi:hypothetical protein J6590_051714 [Homalodisca vitripennis]|nr:hypothetical protein J6590_051714 [Homalodisca vitripennis]